MKFARSLVYVDLTNRCENGCAFCMYKPVQAESKLYLNAQREASLSRLFGSAAKVCLSGEGEPLQHPDLVLTVLRLVRSKPVDLITSAFVPRADLEAFLDRVDRVAATNQLVLTLRVSVDRWHLAADRHSNYGFLFEFFARRTGNMNLRLAVRSVTTDIEAFPQILAKSLRDSSNAYEFRQLDKLNGVITSGPLTIPVQFKNVVRPAASSVKDLFPLHDYIKAMTLTLGRPITFGYLSRTEPFPGINMLVKPDGRILLYGLEPEGAWTLDSDEVSELALQAAVAADPVLRVFYTIPLCQLLPFFDQFPDVSATMREVNSPFWVLKEVAACHPEQYRRALDEIVMRHTIPVKGSGDAASTLAAS